MYYPVVDNGSDGYGSEEMKKRYKEISPLHNVDRNSPPALFVLGTKDPLVSVKSAEAFQKKMTANGGGVCAAFDRRCRPSDFLTMQNH